MKKKQITKEKHLIGLQKHINNHTLYIYIMNDYTFQPEDLIVYEDGGGLQSLGFEIKNSYLNKMPAIIQNGGTKNNTPFAVPAGLYLNKKQLQAAIGGDNFKDTSNIQEDGGHETITGDLYNTLLELVAPRKGGNNKKKKKHVTRKKKKKQNRTTRKNKK